MRTTMLPAGPAMSSGRAGSGALLRRLVIGLTAFLTVVDLFATQAILPLLTSAYGVTPAAMGFAVNAGTLGMALAGLAVALLGRHIDRRQGVFWSLLLLSIPTALLAHAPSLAAFTLLRVLQGLLMAAAFALTLAYLAERSAAADLAGAFAAYITGNVASNLVGRLISAAAADHLGLAWNFYLFALLNLAGALLVWSTLKRTPPMRTVEPMAAASAMARLAHFRDPRLRAGFAVGFFILFAFIGTFTFVNFVLVRPPLSVGMMTLGLVYLVFLPSILTTPLAGGVVRRLGARRTLWAALAVAGLGLPMLLAPSLPWVMAGLALVGVGTFLAQATATGFVNRTAGSDRAAASGIYLACYFLGGIVGTALLGQLFDRLGWAACVAGIGAALAAAALLAIRMTPAEGAR